MRFVALVPESAAATELLAPLPLLSLSEYLWDVAFHPEPVRYLRW